MVGSRQLHNRTLWICLAALFALQVIAVQVGVAPVSLDTVLLDPLSERSASRQRPPW